MNTMKAVVYDLPGEFEVRQIPVPQPGPGEVLLRVVAAGVCGTDLHLHDGQFLAAFPLIPGHEVVGIVDQVGDGVEAFTLGQQVTVNPNASCGHCSYCRAGRFLMCPDLTGMGSNRPGTFAEYVTAPVSQVFSVAQQYIGTPYVYGGASPAGFDCSGYVMYVYAQFGINLPHSVSGQAAMGKRISIADAQPGDLVIMSGHDGFYAGNGNIMDAPDVGRSISIRPIWTSDYYIVRLGI